VPTRRQASSRSARQQPCGGERSDEQNQIIQPCPSFAGAADSFRGSAASAVGRSVPAATWNSNSSSSCWSIFQAYFARRQRSSIIPYRLAWAANGAVAWSDSAPGRYSSERHLPCAFIALPACYN
jgi:hypothetical protein